MAFQLQAYVSSISNGAVFLQVSSLADTFANPQNNNYVVGPLNNVIAVAGFGTNLTRVRFSSPSLAGILLPDIYPLRTASLTAGTQDNLLWWGGGGPTLKQTEQLSAFCIQSNAGAQVEYVFVWLADSAPQPVNQAGFAASGDFYTVRFTGTTTVTSNAWSVCPLTSEQNLPVGTYTVIGARAKSATGVAFRLGVASYAYRPGGLCCTDDLCAGPVIQRFGGMGPWLSFTNVQVLQADFLCSAGDTAQTVDVDLFYRSA